MKSMSENPYIPAKGEVPSPQMPPKTPVRGALDVVLFAMIAFAAAPAIWTVMWFFGIYLGKSDRDDYFTPTEWEKFDTLYGYYVWTFFISVLVAPIVFLWRLAVNSRPSRRICEPKSRIGAMYGSTPADSR